MKEKTEKGSNRENLEGRDLGEGDEGEVVKRRQIDTGATRGDRVAISAGLAAGERVVSAGQVKLRDGQAIQADDKASPGERAGGKDATSLP